MKLQQLVSHLTQNKKVRTLLIVAIMGCGAALISYALLEVSGNIKLSGASSTTVPAPLEAGAAVAKDYVDAAGLTQIVTSCGWITHGASGVAPAVGSCTPTACPSGYTDKGIIGCTVTTVTSCTAQATCGLSSCVASHWYSTYNTYGSQWLTNNCGGAAGACYRACTL